MTVRFEPVDVEASFRGRLLGFAFEEEHRPLRLSKIQYEREVWHYQDLLHHLVRDIKSDIKMALARSVAADTAKSAGSSISSLGVKAGAYFQSSGLFK